MVTPADAYRLRLSDLRAEEARLDRRLAWSGNARFALLLAILVLAVVLAQFRSISPAWLALPVGGFVALTIVFGRALQRLTMVRRAIAYADAGLARLEHRWAGRGVSGAEYLDENHPCAADLDLFGRGSLFELLCTAKTRAGRDTLAHWLLDPAGPDEVGLRQAAVRELSAMPTERERLALLGGDVPEGLNTTALATWGDASERDRETGRPGDRENEFGLLVSRSPGLLVLFAGSPLCWSGLRSHRSASGHSA